MGIKTGYAPGTFCWADVRATDQAAAKAFYTGLFGWDAIDIPIGDGLFYTMVQNNGHTVAAISPMPPEMRANGVPQHWGSYISVDDADSVTARAKELGATVLAEPFDVFTSGRMAAIQDPTGAVFNLWQPKDHFGAELTAEPGSSAWDELMTTDAEAASAFYRGLFGWTIAEHSPIPESYTVFQHGEQMVGGMMQIQPEWGQVPPHWGVYFAVENTDATVAKALELGGSLLHGPIDLAEVGRMATLHDPQGGVINVIQSARQG